MPPKVLPPSVVKHPRVALIAPSSTIEPDPRPNRESRFDDAVSPRWLRVVTAVKYSGINRSRLFKLISEGVIKTASLKEHAKARRGLRLIDRWSLDLYLETLSKPVEERLVQEFNQLQLEEEVLSKQHAALLEKQRSVERKLTEIRKSNLEKIQAS